MHKHLINNDIVDNVQSAYKVGHSCETDLLMVYCIMILLLLLVEEIVLLFLYLIYLLRLIQLIMIIYFVFLRNM